MRKVVVEAMEKELKEINDESMTIELEALQHDISELDRELSTRNLSNGAEEQIVRSLGSLNNRLVSFKGCFFLFYSCGPLT